MSNNRPVYCWDTNVLLAWLGDEPGAPLADIDLVRGEIDRGEAKLLVPVIAYAEVLEAKHTTEQMDLFRRFLQRSNVEVANVTPAVAEKAGQVRGRALGLSPAVKLRTPDALYIATAIVFKAAILHTLEANQLPQLSGTGVVDGLKIGPPRPLHGTSSFLNPPSAVPAPPPDTPS
jgi:predicted nucleic acid-binding protein